MTVVTGLVWNEASASTAPVVVRVSGGPVDSSCGWMWANKRYFVWVNIFTPLLITVYIKCVPDIFIYVLCGPIKIIQVKKVYGPKN